MSSKQASVNLTPAMLANIKSTMKNLDTFSVNWAGVKAETGVSSNGNAAQSFRTAMKALGLKVVDSKNWKFADIDDDSAAAATDSPAKASGKKRGRPKKTNNGDSGSPIVKRQKKDKEDIKVQVKQEGEAQAEDQAGETNAEGTEVAEDK